MSPDLIPTTLVIDTGDEDLEFLESAMQSLIVELDALGLEEIVRPTETAPPGTRGLGAFELGTLLVTVGGAGATIPALIGLLHDWLRRRNTGVIRVKIGEDEIELTGAPEATQKRLVEEFLSRHEK
jgi:hypothetical protein